MIQDVVLALGVALVAGMLAQVVAARTRMPGILLLLATGVLLGPDVSGVLDRATFRDARSAIVATAVTVILFEGALFLDRARLRALQRPLARLLLLGAVTSLAVGTLAAHHVLGLPPEIALLYGALMIVTGPTVVTPLLSRLPIPRRLRELLIGEGILIDPFGAVIALAAAEWVAGHASASAAGDVALRLGVGAAVGLAAGLLLALPLRRGWIPETLLHAFVLAWLLLAAAIANTLAPESGLMTGVVLGATLANAGLQRMPRLREFKESISVLLLSFLFVVLAADLELASVVALGLPGLLVVALLIWVARPLAVFPALAGSDFGLKDRLFAAWICPRGIVAASVAGLFRTLLDRAGIPGGAELQALVFLTVFATVALQGLTAGPVSRLLGLDFPALSETIVVGADRLGRRLARALVDRNRPVVLIDRNPWHCDAARSAGITTLEGDALQPDTLEAAGARSADTLVALTRNAELNVLIAQRARENFPIERLVVFAAGASEPPTSGLLAGFPGSAPSADDVNRGLASGALVLREWSGAAARSEPSGAALRDLAYGDREFALLLERGDASVVATGELLLGKGDRLWCIGPPAPTAPEGGKAEREGGTA